MTEYNWQCPPTIEGALRNARRPENPTERLYALQELRKMIQTCEDHQLRTNAIQDEKTLQKFLAARKYDVPESFELFKNHHWFRVRHPAIFANLTSEAPDIRAAIENGLPGVLPHKDRKGRNVLVFSGSNWDCSYSLLSIFRAFWLILERYTDHIHNQTNGFVVIIDLTDLKHTSSLQPTTLKLMIEGMQDCFPARFKDVHFVGHYWFVKMMVNVMKPFLNDNIKERINVHLIDVDDISTLHQHVHKDVLPVDMGGVQPPFNSKAFLAFFSGNGDTKK